MNLINFWMQDCCAVALRRPEYRLGLRECGPTHRQTRKYVKRKTFAICITVGRISYPLHQLRLLKSQEARQDVLVSYNIGY